MGNAGSSTIPRERHKSSSSDMPSSPVLKDGQAFVFDNKYLTRERQGSSHDEEEPYYTKPATKPTNTSTNELPLATARIASSESSVSLKDGAVVDPNKKKALPTVVHIYIFLARQPNSISHVYRLLIYIVSFSFHIHSSIQVQMGRWRQRCLHQRHLLRVENTPNGQESWRFCHNYRFTRGRPSVQILRWRRMASRSQIGECKWFYSWMTYCKLTQRFARKLNS